jgi:hypothetical protein
VPLIAGPPKDVVFGWAHDFAEAAIEIHKVHDADEAAKAETAEKLRAGGGPGNLDELVEMAVDAVRRHELGWYRRNQFLGGLLGYCVLLGMPRNDAHYLKDLIKARLKTA